MEIYVGLILCSMCIIAPKCFAGLGHKLSHRIQLDLSGIILIGLTLLYVFRGYSVGTDYGMYRALYFQDPAMLASQGIEKGFIWIYKLALTMGDFRIFSLISFFLFISGCLFYTKVHGSNTLQSLAWIVLSYLYFSSFNIVRQMAAYGVVMAGLAVLESKSLQKQRSLAAILYVFFVLIASTLHTSAIIALIIPFVMKARIGEKSIIFGTIFTTVMFFSHILNSVIPKLMVLFPNYLEKYGETTEVFTNSSKGVLEFIPILLQFIILYIMVAKHKSFTESNSSAVSMFFFYLVLFSGAGNESMLRLQVYTEYFIVILFERFFAFRAEKVSTTSVNVLKMAILVFFGLYALLRLGRNIGGIVPYSFS